MDSSNKFGLSFFLAVLFHLLLLALFILGLSLKPEIKVKNNVKAMQATVVEANQIQTITSTFKPSPQIAPPTTTVTSLPKQQAAQTEKALNKEVEKTKVIAKKKVAEQAEKIKPEKSVQEQQALQLAVEQKKVAEVETAKPEKLVQKPHEQKKAQEQTEKIKPEKLVQEQEVLRLAEEKKKAEAAKQTEMQKPEQTDQLKKVQNENDIKQIAAKIGRKVKDSWTPPVSAAKGLSCTIRVKLNSNGVVISAQAISPCSDNELFKRSAENAVNKASPLPVPTDKVLFEQYFKVFTFTFSPE